MSYRHNRKTGGLFRVEGTPYSEPAMAIQELRRVAKTKELKVITGTRALANYRRDFDGAPGITEVVTVQYDDGSSFDAIKDNEGWHIGPSGEDLDRLFEKTYATKEEALNALRARVQESFPFTHE